MRSRYTTSLSFIDLLFNMVLSFVAMFLLTILLVNPPKQDSTINTEAKYVVVIRWQDGSSHDIDLWMTNEKERVYFRSKQSLSMSLDRDDLGPDSTETNQHFLPKNEEIMSIRVPTPGVYTAAIHWYAERADSPMPLIRWGLLRVDTGQLLYGGTVTLSEKGEEKTLIRFTINSEGNVVDADVLNQYPFITKVL